MIRSFDHTAHANQQYHQLKQAMEEFARTIEGTVTTEEWLDMVHDAAVSLLYTDCCTQCRWDEPPAAPVKATVEDGWVQGTYRCSNNHQWRCGYAVWAPFHL